MTDTEQLLRRTVKQAAALDPKRIEDTIVATAGDWPGGGSTEAVTGGGLSDPTVLAVLRRIDFPPGDDTRDLVVLNRAVAGYITAISSITRKTSSITRPATWTEATTTARQLLDDGIITTALDVGTNITADILRAHDHVTTLQRVHDGHCAHPPDTFTRVMQSETGCRSCARFGGDTKRVTKMLCQWCWRQVQDLDQLGDPVELQTDRNCWPSEAMWRAKQDGRTADLMRQWQDWLRSHNLNPIDVHRRRQQRRTAC